MVEQSETSEMVKNARESNTIAEDKTIRKVEESQYVMRAYTLAYSS